MTNINEVLMYFPKRIQNELNRRIAQKGNSDSMTLLEEVRIRVSKPVILKYLNGEEILENLIVSQEEVLEILQCICNNSVYSYQNQICNGYITLKGGHRVGITGSVVLNNDEKVSNINYISSLNFRIAKQIIGASNRLLKYVLNVEENSVYDTLIISPPGARKDYDAKGFNKKN